MTKKTKRKVARTATLPSRSGATPDLRRLGEALAHLNPGATPAEVARQVVELAKAQPGIEGARLWHLGEEGPTVWEKTGRLPSPDRALVEGVLAGPERVQVKGPVWAGLLASDGQLVGVLEAHGAKAVAPQLCEWLELFRRYAGVTLAHTEQLRVVDELTDIIEATKRLNSTLDLAELINIILQLATKHTKADRGAVFLVDKVREEIWSLVALGLEQQEIRLPWTKGIAGWVAQKGETVNLRDVYTDPRFEPEVDKKTGYRTHTLLCMPIRNKDNEIIGVLQLLNKQNGSFSHGDESVLSALSDHVALALDNARLHRESLLRQRMERDLELARSIQRSLLPEQPPHLDGFDIAVSHRPSQMVGGDYYDFVSLADDTLLTVIADVEGKGVASGLVMANLQATLRALVAHLHSLERLVGAVNNTILADTRARKFMTFFACMLDRRNRALHYINAGHVPPAVLRGSETLYLREGGMVMGVFPDVPYDRGYLPLETGDILVGCTDGITEAMDVHDEEYGLERLVALVRKCSDQPAQQIVEAVLDEVDRYSRGGSHEDDRIIHVLKVL